MEPGAVLLEVDAWNWIVQTTGLGVPANPNLTAGFDLKLPGSRSEIRLVLGPRNRNDFENPKTLTQNIFLKQKTWIRHGLNLSKTVKICMLV